MNALLAFLFSFFCFLAIRQLQPIYRPLPESAGWRTESPRIMHIQATELSGDGAWQEKVHGKVTLKILVYKGTAASVLPKRPRRARRPPGQARRNKIYVHGTFAVQPVG